MTNKFLSGAAMSAIVALTIASTPAVAAQCDAPEPAMLAYGAPPEVERYLGAYAGRLGENGDQVCVTLYVERMDADGNVEGKYAVGDWAPWGIDAAVYPFNGRIDPGTGEGKVHPGSFTISVDIDPEAGTMDYLFHGKSTNTPGDLALVDKPQ